MTVTLGIQRHLQLIYHGMVWKGMALAAAAANLPVD